jgi:hypothetical protein
LRGARSASEKSCSKRFLPQFGREDPVRLVRAQACEKWRPTADLAGQRPLEAARLHGRNICRTEELRSTAVASGTAKWRFGPSKKRHFPPVSSTFWAIFPAFFREIAHQDVNGRECDTEMGRYLGDIRGLGLSLRPKQPLEVSWMRLHQEPRKAGGQNTWKLRNTSAVMSDRPSGRDEARTPFSPTFQFCVPRLASALHWDPVLRHLRFLMFKAYWQQGESRAHDGCLILE